MSSLFKNRKSRTIILIIVSLLSFSSSALTQKTPGNPKEYFTIENFYRVKWGHADEFIELWKANHYPLLKKALEKGDIISIKAEKPLLHSGEDTRWDFRVTLVFRTVALAFDENLTAPYKKQLYPDQEALTRAEQHRFEILLSHWDVEVGEVALD
jgi:hypothetical protein